jgi:hypothetical protein
MNLKKRNSNNNEDEPVPQPRNMLPKTNQDLINAMEASAKELERSFDSVLILGRDDATGLYHCWRGGYHNALGMAEEFKMRVLNPQQKQL